MCILPLNLNYKICATLSNFSKPRDNLSKLIYISVLTFTFQICSTDALWGALWFFF